MASNMKLFYLATPYSKYRGGLVTAYEMACQNAAFLLERGVPVFSPIAHTHSVALFSKVALLDTQFWLDADWPILTKCDGLIVLKADGWDQSYGVDAEIKKMQRLGRPVFDMWPMTMPEGLRKAVWSS